MVRDQLAISGDDFDVDSACLECGQRGTGALLWRIEKRCESRKDELRFVAHDGMGMIPADFPPGDSDYAEALALQRMVLVADAGANGFIHRTSRLNVASFTYCAERQYVIRCTFDDEQA